MEEIKKELIQEFENLKFFLQTNDVNCVKNKKTKINKQARR